MRSHSRGLIVPRHDHRHHAALDHAEFLRDRAIGEIRSAAPDHGSRQGSPWHRAPVGRHANRPRRKKSSMAAGESSFSCLSIMRPCRPTSPLISGGGGLSGARKIGDDALLPRPPSFAVEAAGGLRDLVEPGLRAPARGKVEIDAGFDQGGRDQPARRVVASSRWRTSPESSRRCAAYWRVVRCTRPSSPAACAAR